MALLAQLRRGAGKTPDQVPELWGLTGTEALYAQGPMEEGQAAQAETAVHLAVTLYALHQQSQRSRRMHVPGIEIGAAVRQLMPPTGIDEAVRKRFVRVGTAATPGLLAVRLREVVTLLRREEIPLDYALLADRLYQAQQPGECARYDRSGAAASTPTASANRMTSARTPLQTRNRSRTRHLTNLPHDAPSAPTCAPSPLLPSTS